MTKAKQATEVDEQQTPQAPGEAKAQLQVAMLNMSEMFATLVPPETIEIEDVTYAAHKVRSMLPARSQIRIIQLVDDVFETGLMGKVADTETRADMVLRLLKAARDKRVLTALVDAFTTAHPQAVEAAKANVTGEGMPYEDAADAFAAEELIAGLVPFSARFAGRLAVLLGEITGSQDNGKA